MEVPGLPVKCIFAMVHYSDRIRDHFLNPRNVGDVEGAEAVGDVGSLTCGGVLRLTLNVDASSQKITDAKFQAAGCRVLVAAASALTEILKGMVIGEAAAMSEAAVAELVGGHPPDKAHCIALCREALHEAAVYYRSATLEEWTGDEALICTCFGVSEKSIERAIHAHALHTIAQVTRACNAGGGCGSCRPLIEDILEDYWRTECARS